VNVDYLWGVPLLDQIRRALSAHEAVALAAEGKRRAAVALVLRQAGDLPEVLFIERARREDDPWSGHMAFPGGRVDPGDDGARSAAERETLEEVGLDLANGELLGRLDDMHGHHAAGVPALVISAFVYHVADPEPLVPNHEVHDSFWFPVPSLLDPERQVDYPLRSASWGPYPGIRVGAPESQVVWGLTYRFLEILLNVSGLQLPHRRERS
jgi:8-oxo-dGTP pyrophosphatase MutT (NUDIX family)